MNDRPAGGAISVPPASFLERSMMMTSKRSLIALAAGVAATAAQAQVPQIVAIPMPATLTVTAEGRVTQAPDLAEVSGGVVTQAPTATAAMAENAVRMNAVVAAVRRAGLADRDIQTSGLNLQPQYKYGQNEAPVLTGYQATNTVTLRIRKLGDAGKLLDTLVQVGANQLNGPTFRVDNADKALDAARNEAVAKARARADLYARAAGVRIKRILTIAESAGQDGGPRPIMTQMREMKADAAPSPVEPGEVAMTVNVTMAFELE